MKLDSYLKKTRRVSWWLTAVVMIFFLSSLILVKEGPIFISPDESANAFFIKQFAQTGNMFFYEPLNLSVGDVLHPRSIISINGRLVPGGFLGLPLLYGGLSMFFGLWLAPFLTLFFARLA